MPALATLSELRHWVYKTQRLADWSQWVSYGKGFQQLLVVGRFETTILMGPKQACRKRFDHKGRFCDLEDPLVFEWITSQIRHVQFTGSQLRFGATAGMLLWSTKWGCWPAGNWRCAAVRGADDTSRPSWSMGIAICDEMVEAWGGRVPLSQLVLWENILRLRERGYWGKLLQLLLYLPG